MAVRVVQKNGRKYFRVRMKIGDKIRTKFVRIEKGEHERAKNEARDVDAAWEVERQASLRGKPATPVEVPTFAEFVGDGEGEETDGPFLRYQRGINRPNEMRSKRSIVRMHLLEAFGDLRLDEITVARVDAYKGRKLGGLAPNSVRNHVTLVKRVLVVAEEWGLLSSRPTIKQVKKPVTDFNYLSEEEAVRLIDAAEDGWRLFVHVAVRCGLRLAELRGLRWGDVDLASQRIRVARSFSKAGWGPTKGKPRTVDLAWDVSEALRKERPKRAAKGALVFPGPSSNPRDEKACLKAVGRSAKAAGIGRKATVHDLRHTFASLHVMAATPLVVVQQWLGHQSIETTMRYAHLAPSTTARWANAASPNRGLVGLEGGADPSSGVTTDVTKLRPVAENGS